MSNINYFIRAAFRSKFTIERSPHDSSVIDSHMESPQIDLIIIIMIIITYGS